MGVNVAINALLMLLLIFMTIKTIPVLTTVQFKVGLPGQVGASDPILRERYLSPFVWLRSP